MGITSGEKMKLFLQAVKKETLTELSKKVSNL